jgi:hypothetical protein
LDLSWSPAASSAFCSLVEDESEVTRSVNSETIGVCRVCRKRLPLDFEHVPPRSAFNRAATETVSLADFEAWRAGSLSPEELPKGPGYKSLCRECNQRTGDRYVPELMKASRALMMVVFGVAIPIDPTVSKFVGVELGPIFPLRFVKQIVTMLLAINEEKFAQDHAELGEFVRLRDRTGLSDRYRVYLGVFSGWLTRQVPADAGAGFDLKSQTAYRFTEIAYPPFLHAMTIDDPRPPLSVGDITGFTRYRYKEEEKSLRLHLVLDSGRPTPLPYAARAFPDDLVNRLKDNLPLADR